MFSPLEQFKVVVIQNDFSVVSLGSTEVIATIATIGCVVMLIQIIKESDLIIPNLSLIIPEYIYLFISDVMRKTVKTMTFQRYFLIIFNLFLFFAFSNIFGLIPFFFSITSQFIITCALSISLMVGITILGVQLHGDNFLSLFIPNGISIFLAPMLIAIEIISYVFRGLSLAIRLFANMMAGHTLLQIITTFTWLALCSSNFNICLTGILGSILLVGLFFLECGVAIIQSYVFTLLICLYFNDVINLH